MISDTDTEKEAPLFFDKLAEADKLAFYTLRDRVASPDNRYTRFRRLATLQECFDEIRAFCIRHDDEDSVRCLVCGIYWFDTTELAINTRQLRILLAKSKSSINGALAKMKYITLPTKDVERDRLIAALPALRGDWLEIRQWTIRRPTSMPTADEVSWPEPEAVSLPEIPERDQSWDFDGFDFTGTGITEHELDATLGCFLQFCTVMPGVGQSQDLLGFGFSGEE
jgi:hypothetical protein